MKNTVCWAIVLCRSGFKKWNRQMRWIFERFLLGFIIIVCLLYGNLFAQSNNMHWKAWFGVDINSGIKMRNGSFPLLGGGYSLGFLWNKYEFLYRRSGMYDLVVAIDVAGFIPYDKYSYEKNTKMLYMGRSFPRQTGHSSILLGIGRSKVRETFGREEHSREKWDISVAFINKFYFKIIGFSGAAIAEYYGEYAIYFSLSLILGKLW